ncbi:MAG: rhomboid family intramembrane serine protease [Lewinellaceae bacterium]|nr:rhomboid family intramembrane serine protease [Lewinella sp.]MCB9281487.1 rhomboid family intramembrane serine protease [Lewinellaceae bacterium]
MITIILVVLTGIISYQAFNNPEFKAKLLFHPVTIQNQGEWYRFISSGFIHSDWGHLFINMFVLYQFGQIAEGMFDYIFGDLGHLAYIIFYLSAIAMASLPSYFRYRNNYGYAALGASGATSALVFAYILFAPWEWFVFPPVPAIVFGVLYLLYSSYMDKRGGDNIGHNAHFWGAVYGLAFILLSILLFKPVLFPVILDNLMQGPWK